MQPSRWLVPSRQSIARVAAGLFFVALLAGVLLPWWHNHDRLNDFYDYGVTIAAAGKMKAGERPYVDFLTPIQTLNFLCAWLAETCFGPRYLSLTYLNGCFIAGSFAGFTWLLRRAFGWWLAMLMAAAVVAASSVQHSIVWYNALGVAWVAVVVWALAPPETDRRRRVARWLLVFAVLWLSGMTKLTYHVGAVAFAVLFAGRDAWRRLTAAKETAVTVAGIVVFGVIAPVATEMLYTGASLSGWAQNVLGLASSRVELLRAIGTRGFYFNTPHAYYQPMHLPAVGAWGASLLAIVAAAAGWEIGRRKEGRGREVALLGATAGGAFACGTVFLAVHLEIAYLAGAAWLALAGGLTMAWLGEGTSGGPARVARVALGLAAAGLLATAWHSSWVGARALFRGTGDALEGATYVTADDLPPRFAYVRGLRITPAWHRTLEAFDAMVETDGAVRRPVSGYYLVNGAEWLVRALPAATHRGMPLWLQSGTTYSPANERTVAAPLEHGMALHTLVAIENWDFWTRDLGRVLEQRYQRETSAGLLRVYRLKADLAEPFSNPVGFGWNLDSNVPSRAIRTSRGAVDIRVSAQGFFLGSDQSHALEVAAGIDHLEGEVIVQLSPWNPPEAGEASFRVSERVAGQPPKLRWLQHVSVTRDQPLVRLPFAIAGEGGALEFEADLAGSGGVEAGWRKLRTNEAEFVAPRSPGPLQMQTKRWKPDALWRTALFDGQLPRLKAIEVFGLDVRPEFWQGHWELFSHAGSEIWLELDDAESQVSGEFGLREGAWTQASSASGFTVSVIFSKAGRRQTLMRRELDPRHTPGDKAPQHFEVHVPEPGGWVGLMIEPREPGKYDFGHFSWRKLRIH